MKYACLIVSVRNGKYLCEKWFHISRHRTSILANENPASYRDQGNQVLIFSPNASQRTTREGFRHLRKKKTQTNIANLFLETICLNKVDSLLMLK